MRPTTGGRVEIQAIDDSGWKPTPVLLDIAADETVHFNSKDLETGNDSKGLEGYVGSPASGDWRLRLSSDLDIEVLAYIRTEDGFLTSMHDLVPRAVYRHRVSTFNPGRNTNQVSKLKLINPDGGPAEITIKGIDGHGASPGSDVRLTVPGGAARTVTAQELESGHLEGLAGSLGEGHGKWQLIVASDRAIRLMSLLESPTGHLTNLSTRPPIRLPAPVSDSFERFNDLEPKSWWKDSTPYSCQPVNNPDSPWEKVGMRDPGGSDPLSLIRYFGNGSYVRYGYLGFEGCTIMWKYPERTHLDSPIAALPIQALRIVSCSWTSQAQAEEEPGTAA